MFCSRQFSEGTDSPAFGGGRIRQVTSVCRLALQLVGVAFALGYTSHAIGQDLPAGEPAPKEAPVPVTKEEPVQIPEEEPDPIFEEAKERFKQGVALAKAGNCEGAIAELRASYELVPRTNTLFNIAQCHEELFQYNLAIAAYDRFLEVAEDDEPDRIRVETTIRSLRNLLGTLIIKSNIEAEVWLGNRKIGTSPGEILIPGGRHEVELRAKGYLPTRQEVVIAGRESISLDYELIVAQKEITITKIKSRGLKPVYFWGGTTATGLVLVGGLYFGLRAKLEDSAAHDIDPRLPRDEQRDDIDTLSNVADILFLTAGAFAVGTTVTYFLTDWGKKESRGESRSVSVMPTIGLNNWGVRLEGRL